MDSFEEICLDCAVILARNGRRLRQFYQDILHLPVHQKAERWIEFRIGSEVLAIAHREEWLDECGGPGDGVTQQFRFLVSSEQVERCASDLARARTPYAFGATYRTRAHRALFFRDPEGNVLEFRSGNWTEL
jgi:catechol-2,3-dioxygenase